MLFRSARLSLCSATREAAIVRGLRTAMKSGPRLPQLEKALAQKQTPNTAKNKYKNKLKKKKNAHYNTWYLLASHKERKSHANIIIIIHLIFVIFTYKVVKSFIYFKDIINSCNMLIRQREGIIILVLKMNRASLVAQWLRICLPMQGTRVRALVWEDPTCRGATRPVSHNY